MTDAVARIRREAGATARAIPADYEQRVYAGVLGKLIGVYLGRPVEGWSHERITSELGEIRGYVHAGLGLPLVVTDDDVSGTFTFFRSLEDAGGDADLSAEAIGRAWLNYLIEGRTVLWWGGLGHSTEHTAWLRLRAGVPAPESGSARLNGPVVAEQIGAQIFIDAWALACPGDPERAGVFARRAASVSHDGAAVDAAVLLAAMEAESFREPGIDHLLDTGLGLIPGPSPIRRLVGDLREWHARGLDWRSARARLAERYASDRFPGNVHVVPNHGLIQLGLLWGGDDFSTSMTIVNTSGWDTDCNSGNLGCLQGIRLGLEGFQGPVDWRGPVADRLYVVSAEGGRAITDAVIEADRIALMGRRVAGAPIADHAALGPRFRFGYPGALQGFHVVHAIRAGERGHGRISNVALDDGRCLRIERERAGDAVVAATATFITPDDRDMPGYPLLASPTLHPGQTLRASLASLPGSSETSLVRLAIAHFDARDELAWRPGEVLEVPAGRTLEGTWVVPDTGGQPIAKVGVELLPGGAAGFDLRWLTWDGCPVARLDRPREGGTLWRRAWVDGVDAWHASWPEAFRISQDHGTGLLMQGSLEWTDYRVDAIVTPHMARAVGLAARVGGLRRHYAVRLVEPGRAELVRSDDEGVEVLADGPGAWQPYRAVSLGLEVEGPRLRAWLDGSLSLDVVDDSPRARAGGGIGLLCEEGTLACDTVTIGPPGDGHGPRAR